MPGVRHVNIDYAKKRIAVSVEQEDFDTEKLIEALESEGFGGSVVDGSDEPAAGSESAGDESDEQTEGQSDVPPLPSIPTDGADAAGGEKKKTSSTSGSFGKHVAIGVHLDKDALHPGDAFRIAVVLDVKEGWHVYGNPLGPGIGLPTVVSAATAGGIQIEPPRYAPAHKSEQDFGDGGTTWVWEHTGQTVHYLTGRIDAEAEPADIELGITVSGQICTAKSCHPGSVTVPLSVRIVSADSPTKEDNKKLFEGFEQAQAVPKVVGK